MKPTPPFQNIKVVPPAPPAKKEEKKNDLSALGSAAERAITDLMASAKWNTLKFHEQMTVLDRALKLEAIRQKATDDKDGSWFRSQFGDEEVPTTDEDPDGPE